MDVFARPQGCQPRAGGVATVGAAVALGGAGREGLRAVRADGGRALDGGPFAPATGAGVGVSRPPGGLVSATLASTCPQRGDGPTPVAAGKGGPELAITVFRRSESGRVRTTAGAAICSGCPPLRTTSRGDGSVVSQGAWAAMAGFEGRGPTERDARSSQGGAPVAGPTGAAAPVFANGPTSLIVTVKVRLITDSREAISVAIAVSIGALSTASQERGCHRVRGALAGAPKVQAVYTPHSGPFRSTCVE